MKSVTLYLMLFCSVLSSLPARSWASPSPLSSGEKTALAAISQPALLQQSAGRVAVIIEPGRGRGRWHGGYAYGISAGAVILTAVLVTLIIVDTGPGIRRY